MRRAVLLLVLIAIGRVAVAHELRPAYLELRQISAERYEVLWKVPGRGDDERLGLYVALPPDCVPVSQRRGIFADSTYTERWSVRCAGGLSGNAVHITGLAATVTDVLARVSRLDGSSQVTRVTASAPSFVVAGPSASAEGAAPYIKSGIAHVGRRLDSLLLVVGLVMLARGAWPLAKIIIAFTLAQSITLALSTFGVAVVPQRPVEATIALSIVFVAAEAARRPRRTAAGAQWAVAFVCGLLHGLGCAAAVTEVGLPQQAMPLALLSFDLGITLGQFALVATLLGIIRLARRSPQTLPAWSWRVAPYAIGGIGAFWVIQTVAAF